MNVRREDKIGIGCAFAGAALGAFVAAPMFGGTPAVFTAIGVGLGWSLSKVIIGHLDHAEKSKSEDDARTDKAKNDAEFARALFGDDELDRK
ncbi:hypothetical protein L0664_05625 [Octadecabacter sp. G9-8]|uniref:Uncharacterized protein n=1 Tax=Octadecabacter dasysiphoniae TaxID=2909341 RepID=A0ABS9CVX4_9RHOB|nr:hypothetical protein [Octadecabacter dasysiphoniae]MCF2870540.1 hypothetical protein [Octadecabacter dasysiphoniae]